MSIEFFLHYLLSWEVSILEMIAFALCMFIKAHSWKTELLQDGCGWNKPACMKERRNSGSPILAWSTFSLWISAVIIWFSITYLQDYYLPLWFCFYCSLISFIKKWIIFIDHLMLVQILYKIVYTNVPTTYAISSE